jgi:hypothetical protein
MSSCVRSCSSSQRQNYHCNVSCVRFRRSPPVSATPPPLLRHTLLFACPCYGLISLSWSGQPAGLCHFCRLRVSRVCARTVCPCAPREGLGWEAWTLSWFDGSDGLHTGIGRLSMVEGCGSVWAWGPDLEGFLPLHACLSMMSLSGSVAYIASSGGSLHPHHDLLVLGVQVRLPPLYAPCVANRLGPWGAVLGHRTAWFPRALWLAGLEACTVCPVLGAQWAWLRYVVSALAASLVVVDTPRHFVTSCLLFPNHIYTH